MLEPHQVDHLSNLNVDVAHRLGYDDFNESMCDRNIVQVWGGTHKCGQLCWRVRGRGVGVQHAR